MVQKIVSSQWNQTILVHKRYFFIQLISVMCYETNHFSNIMSLITYGLCNGVYLPTDV